MPEFRESLKKTLTDGGKPAVRVNISSPRFSGIAGERALARINGFYSDMARAFASFAEKALLERAVADTGRERPYGALLDYKVTLDSPPYLCVYVDAGVYSGGARERVARRVSLWDTRSGTLLPLRSAAQAALRAGSASLSERAAPRAKSLPALSRRGEARAIFDQAELRAEKGEAALAALTPAAALRWFDPRSFYLIPDGYVYYYPQGTICPPAYGIPEFRFYLR